MDNSMMNRRKFIKKSAGFTAYAAFGMILPGVFNGVAKAARLPDVVVATGVPGATTRAAVNALGFSPRRPPGRSSRSR